MSVWDINNPKITPSESFTVYCDGVRMDRLVAYSVDADGYGIVVQHGERLRKNSIKTYWEVFYTSGKITLEPIKCI